MAKQEQTLKALIGNLSNKSIATDTAAAKVVRRTLNLLGNNGDAGMTEVNTDLPEICTLRDSGQAKRIFDALEVLTADWQGNKFVPDTSRVQVDRKAGTVTLTCEPLELANLMRDRGLVEATIWPVFYGMEKAKGEKAKAQTYTKAEFVKELSRIYKRADPTYRTTLAQWITENGGTVPTKGLV